MARNKKGTFLIAEKRPIRLSGQLFLLAGVLATSGYGAAEMISRVRPVGVHAAVHNQSFPFRLGFLNELFNRVIHDLLTGTAQPLVADHALMVEHVQSGPTLDIPF